MINPSSISLIGKLADPESRRAAADLLAAELGVQNLLIFVVDPDLHVPLPALGFAQTLPNMAEWRDFLARCSPDRIERATLPTPSPTPARMPVAAYTAADHSILALIGGNANEAHARFVSSLLPALSPGFKAEWRALNAKSSAMTLGLSAEKATLLAQQLDAARRESLAALLKSNQARRRSAFLAEAGRKFATAADESSLFAALAGLVVPETADWCAIDVRTEKGHYRRVAIACADPEDRAVASALMPIATEPSFEPVVARIDSVQTARILCFPILAEESFGAVLTVGFKGLRRNDSAEQELLLEQLVEASALTYRKILLYNQVQNAVQIRDEFLAIASHELKTPLTALSLELQFIGRSLRKLGIAPELNAFQDSLKSAIEHSSRLGRLIGTLLDVTRISNGKFTLERTTVDLSILVRQVAARFNEECRNSGARIEVESHCPVPADCDRLRVEQVVTNLISNAVKYGGNLPIRITVRSCGRGADIIVRDQGIGICRQDRSRIFRRFERATLYKNVSGLGLGLYISRQIAEAHGGWIRLSSRPGKGSIFRVRLPIAKYLTITSPHSSLSPPTPTHEEKNAFSH